MSLFQNINEEQNLEMIYHLNMHSSIKYTQIAM